MNDTNRASASSVVVKNQIGANGQTASKAEIEPVFYNGRKIKQVKIKWRKKGKARTLNQEYDRGLSYCFVNGQFMQVHQFVLCKDFLQDALYGYFNKKRISIYGFVYDPNDNPEIYTKKTRLALANKRDESFQKLFLENALPFIHSIEEHLGVAKSIVYQCTNPGRQKCVFVIDGSPKWMYSPPLISLYTLFIRIGMVHNKETETFMDTIQNVKNGKTYFNSHDTAIVVNCYSLLKFILDHGINNMYFSDIKSNYVLNNVQAAHSIGINGLASFYNDYLSNKAAFIGSYNKKAWIARMVQGKNDKK